MTWKPIATAGLVAALFVAGCGSANRTVVGPSASPTTGATTTPTTTFAPRAGTIHLSSTEACPASDQGIHGVSNPAPQSKPALLPAGDPTRVLLCEYYGLNGRPFALWKTSTLIGTSAADFARQVSKLTPYQGGARATNCPMDDGSIALAVLTYPSGQVVNLWIDLSGCAGASNGAVGASGGLGLARPPTAG